MLVIILVICLCNVFWKINSEHVWGINVFLVVYFKCLDVCETLKLVHFIKLYGRCLAENVFLIFLFPKCLSDVFPECMSDVFPECLSDVYKTSKNCLLYIKCF